MARRSHPPQSTPASLRAAERAFARWRADGRPGRRIPEALWRAAVAAARAHGVSRTALALGLNHSSLQRQVDQPRPARVRVARPGTRSSNGSGRSPAPARFVELPPLPTGSAPPACRIDVHGGCDDGPRRVSIELASPALSHLPAVLAALGLAQA